MSTVIKAKLLEKREEFGGYIIYVFENLNYTQWNNQYVMTVRFPNWEAPFLNIGDIGYLNYKEVIAGETTWWNKTSQSKNLYNYDNIIFINFVEEKPQATVML